ncbi:deoxyribodipyrimidine photo-lyase [Oscillatoriales cyanobacterium LEGE 11467]|uniref:Deoxyribodipyrimidine photo-lyase n=1 Tax=Zarconia navalis LEGE 11467 TaxID=1828826 RepID=A0A928VW17_9CYAN|nr:FAD-binding domain-containing protein [Zarconia navalis]MBE9040574.1 deoxyribodipyrimidine photo-lyase [Zarconia navalis LEGE 11467]
MVDLVLFWHRRDLRISDNVGLASAQQLGSRVVGLFCLDPDILQRDDIAPARIKYMLGCLQHLQQAYAQANSQLLILHDRPSQAIPDLATALNAEIVVWNRDVEPYAKSRDRTVSEALQQSGIAVQTYWDRLLHAPGDILTGSQNPYTVYTPFWKNWSRQQKADPLPSLEKARGLTAAELEAAEKVGAGSLPSAEGLGFVWDAPLPQEPGEIAAREKLNQFVESAIFKYSERRNFPAVDGTAGLSAAFKFGILGVRTVWAQTIAAEGRCYSDEARDSVRTWQQELAWREFYEHVMYFFPELAEGPYRPRWQNFPWSDDRDRFQAWCEGRTGYPIVDAAMCQLNQTGWMHNRCRMIVASFLTKDLIVNWQWGEQYFMQHLVDGDLSANNGGWQWSTSSGMDPKPLRIFNPASQAQKYDPEAEYIRRWLPQLKSVDTKYLVTGQIPPEELDGLDYPAPIVDHKQQQRYFKELYQQTKTT